MYGENWLVCCGNANEILINGPDGSLFQASDARDFCCSFFNKRSYFMPRFGLYVLMFVRCHQSANENDVGTDLMKSCRHGKVFCKTLFRADMSY